MTQVRRVFSELVQLFSEKRSLRARLRRISMKWLLNPILDTSIQNRDSQSEQEGMWHARKSSIETRR
jgi:hypothetical protein